MVLSLIYQTIVKCEAEEQQIYKGSDNYGVLKVLLFIVAYALVAGFMLGIVAKGDDKDDDIKKDS